jgi:hypothetical protein
MLDALVIYYLVTNMRHAGYCRVVADFVRLAKARYLSIPSAIMRNRRNAVVIARRSAAMADTAINSALQMEFMQMLTRLESYVTSTN